MDTVSRRGFLGALAVIAIDPEQLIWTPGKKLISIPAEGQFRAGSEIANYYRLQQAMDEMRVNLREDWIFYMGETWSRQVLKQSDGQIRMFTGWQRSPHARIPFVKIDHFARIAS